MSLLSNLTGSPFLRVVGLQTDSRFGCTLPIPSSIKVCGCHETPVEVKVPPDVIPPYKRIERRTSHTHICVYVHASMYVYIRTHIHPVLCIPERVRKTKVKESYNRIVVEK